MLYWKRLIRSSLKTMVDLKDRNDLWALKNGNILFAGPRTGVVEVTPAKKKVWTYRAGKGLKIRSCQPSPNGDALVGMEGKPSRTIEVGRDVDGDPQSS